MHFSPTNSQQYIVNANPDTNHSAHPSSPSGNGKQ